MELCCGMQLEALRQRLLEAREERREPGTVIGSGLASAPYDETLFDAVRLYATVLPDGGIAVGGSVFFWSASAGDSAKSATLRSFSSLDSCLAWMEKGAAGECAEIFDRIR